MAVRLGAATLVSLGLVLSFAALGSRALAAAGTGDTTGAGMTLMLVGLGIAVLCVVAGGVLRHTYGVWLGWLSLAATFGYAVWFPWVALVGAVFLAVWVACLYYGTRLDQLLQD